MQSVLPVCLVVLEGLHKKYRIGFASDLLACTVLCNCNHRPDLHYNEKMSTSDIINELYRKLSNQIYVVTLKNLLKPKYTSVMLSPSYNR